MKNKKVILPLVSVFVIILVFIFYKEGILFNRNGDGEYADSLKQNIDTVKKEVPLGNPPENGNNTLTDTSKAGNSNTGTKPDGSVNLKDIKKESTDTGKKVVPLGDPPSDEKNNNTGKGGNQTPAKEDKIK